MANKLIEQLLGAPGAAVPSLSPKESIILRLLSSGAEMYGLQIVEQSEGSVGRGTVYVTLARMQEKSFVDSRQEEQSRAATGLPRRLYRITAKGVGVLRAWERAAQSLRVQVPT